MPGFALLMSWRYCVTPGDTGEAMGCILIPRPGSMFSSNLERLSLFDSDESSLVLVGIVAYSGRKMRISGDRGETGYCGCEEPMTSSMCQ